MKSEMIVIARFEWLFQINMKWLKDASASWGSGHNLTPQVLHCLHDGHVVVPIYHLLLQSSCTILHPPPAPHLLETGHLCLTLLLLAHVPGP